MKGVCMVTALMIFIDRDSSSDLHSVCPASDWELWENTVRSPCYSAIHWANSIVPSWTEHYLSVEEDREQHIKLHKSFISQHFRQEFFVSASALRESVRRRRVSTHTVELWTLFFVRWPEAVSSQIPRVLSRAILYPPPYFPIRQMLSVNTHTHTRTRRHAKWIWAERERKTEKGRRERWGIWELSKDRVRIQVLDGTKWFRKML